MPQTEAPRTRHAAARQSRKSTDHSSVRLLRRVLEKIRKNDSSWQHCVTCFDTFGLAALIDGQVFCVHGGLSPDVQTLDQVRAVDRHLEIPQGAFCDLVWSDPEDLPSSVSAAGASSCWQISPRGAGYLFGNTVTQEFHHVNQLSLLARAHQLVMEGRKYHFDNDPLVTVWSAPNYCYRCGNVAAVMELGEYEIKEGIGGGEGQSANSNNSNGGDNGQEQQEAGANPTATGETKPPTTQESDDDETATNNNDNNKPSLSVAEGSHNINNGMRQRFKFFKETEHSVYGPKGEDRANLVPYFLLEKKIRKSFILQSTPSS